MEFQTNKDIKREYLPPYHWGKLLLSKCVERMTCDRPEFVNLAVFIIKMFSP